MIYGELTSPDLARIAPKTIALLPLGSIEQHGRHLPVQTDTALVSEIASRAEKAMSQKIVLLPTLWLGSSHHHLGFAGTVSIQSETYIQVLVEMVECLARTGFHRIVLLNGHGGNINPGNEVLYRLNLKWNGTKEPWVAVATYWHVARNELASQKFMETPALTHACEYETSMMLAIRTDWVQLQRAKGLSRKPSSKFYSPTGFPPSRVAVSQSFHQVTETGAMGSPELATAKKGQKLFDLISPVVIEFLKEFSGWKYPRK